MTEGSGNYVDTSSRFYTVEQIAEMSMVDVETVRRWCRNKHIKAVKLGKDWRINKKHFDNKIM